MRSGRPGATCGCSPSTGVFLAGHARGRHPDRAATQLFALFEVYVTLGAAVLASYIIPAEHEQKTWPLLLSYPLGRAALLLHKLVPFLVTLVLTLAAALAAARAIHADLPTLDLLGYALPPILLLSGLAVLVSLLTQSALAGLAASVVYWATDLTFKGELTRWWYLFAASYPRDGLSLTLNKTVVLCTALLAWGASFVAMARGRDG